jgi:hypothetical protein
MGPISIGVASEVEGILPEGLAFGRREGGLRLGRKLVLGAPPFFIAIGFFFMFLTPKM